MKINTLKKLLLVITLSITTTTYAGRACPNSEFFSGKFISDICWKCMFPIKIAGFKMGSGKIPSKASNKRLCFCWGDEWPIPLPHPGIVIGLWEPTRLLEFVRMPGCLATVNGAQLPIYKRILGNSGASSGTIEDETFYQYHYYTFPLMKILGISGYQKCFSDGIADFDIAFISEIDPTWNNPGLSFFTHPEAAVFANPIAITACAVDAVASTLFQSPVDKMIWCAGAWGTMYPYTGQSSGDSMVHSTSLLSARLMSALHRRGFAKRTMGSDTQCRSKTSIIIPKSQYKMNMFYPVPEKDKSHFIGEDEKKWGAGRMLPWKTEDSIYMLFRWNDCCLHI